MQNDAPVHARLKVLLVEDNPGDARLLRYFLSEDGIEQFELEHVETLDAALTRLKQGGIGLVLLDMSLPDSLGLETFTKTHYCAPEVPIIVLSGRDDESLAMQTVQEGAQDYLVKGQVDARLLIRSMRYAIGRKHAEEALAYERDLFRTLLDNLPDRIYFKDAESRFLRISKAVAEQFRIANPQEAIHKTDFDFFAPEHAKAALSDEQQVMATGVPIVGKIEKEVLPNGMVSWALTTKVPLRDKQGKIVGNFGISRDITTLKKYEEQLQNERNLLRNLIDNIPDFIYVKDEQLRYVIDNIAHRRFLGVNSEEEVAGKTVFDFFPPEMAQDYARDDSYVMSQGRAILNVEEPVVDRFGNPCWHSITKVPLRNAHGKIVGLVGINRDITQRKLAEDQLQRAHRELARSKTELEKVFNDLQKSHEELKAAQFQLIQAEKMQSLGRLAAGVAHEVKNPLAIMGMGIDYLVKNNASNDPNVAVILTEMNDALKRADGIIHGLLDFSAPRVLNLQLEDLNVLVEQSLGMVRHEVPSNGPVRVVKELEPNLPKCKLDGNKVKQALVNLMLNAIHSMPNGGTLTLRTMVRELQPGDISLDAGSRLVDRFRSGERAVGAEILDTGSGIPEAQLAKIFDPFFTTKPTGKGTGLGLTVTKKIVELHHGIIDIRNRPEGGVSATLLFPG